MTAVASTIFRQYPTNRAKVRILNTQRTLTCWHFQDFQAPVGPSYLNTPVSKSSQKTGWKLSPRKSCFLRSSCGVAPR